MYISLSTAATILATLAASAPLAEAATVAERSTSLCNKPNYGATLQPWVSDSKPGAFCGKSKPSNSGQWATLPYWDGGDKVKCSGWNKWSLKVCNGGNAHAALPKVCSPPHNFPSGWGAIVSGSTPKVTCKPATCSLGTFWNCFLPTQWRMKCTVSSSNGATTTTTVAGTATPTITDVAPSATSPAAPAATSTAPVDPIQYPVCDLDYQVTYTDYQITNVPNGVWAGTTQGAAAQDASYMTYTLANTVDECLSACNDIEGCVFVNTYYDFNEQEEDLPKHAPGVLTCAMFSTCVGTDKNDNWGGQDDPNQIKNSNGYCKSGACSS